MIFQIHSKINLKHSANLGTIFFLVLLLFASPFVSISGFLSERPNSFVLLEDIDEKEERNEKKELEEFEKIILISDLHKKSNIRAIFCANEKSMQGHLSLCMEVLTPPPQIFMSQRSAYAASSLSFFGA